MADTALPVERRHLQGLCYYQMAISSPVAYLQKADKYPQILLGLALLTGRLEDLGAAS